MGILFNSISFRRYLFSSNSYLFIRYISYFFKKIKSKNFKNLKYLSVVHLPKINDLSPLEALTSLETVSLSTLPSWDSSGKVSVVLDLVPLASLPKLKHLELFGVRPENKSPLELTSSKTLVSVRLSKYAKKLEKELYEKTGLANDWAPEPEFKN